MLKMKIKKENIKRIATDVVSVVIAAIISSVYVHIFVVPADFAPSGIEGLSMILYEITGINIGWFKLFINLPLICLAWRFLNKKYVFFVMLFILLDSAGIIFLEYMNFYQFIPSGLTNAEAVGYRLMSAVCSGVLLGVCIGILLKRGYSSGGVDIIACLVHKWKPHLNVEKVISGCSYIIVGVSYFIYWDLTSILLSIIQIFVGEWTIAGILRRERYAIEVKVVTKHPEQIKDEILYKYEHSATILDGKGMYSGDDYYMVISVMNSRDIPEFMNVMKKYPDTFVYFSDGVRVQGEFHFNEEQRKQGAHIDAYQ